MLTGALHLDGLADTADALGACDRERALEIMRDSRTGSFGAAAIALAVLVEAAALGGLAAERDAVRAFVVAGALVPGGDAAARPLAAVRPLVARAGQRALGPRLGACCGLPGLRLRLRQPSSCSAGTVSPPPPSRAA